MSDNIRKVDLVDIDLNSGNIHRSFLSHSIGMMDEDGNAFGVCLYRDGNPVDLSGAYAQGYFRNPLGEIIAITNNVVSGNKAMVILPKTCYLHDGNFTLTIKVVGGAVTGTMRIVDGVVSSNNTLQAVAPESVFSWEYSAHGWCYMWNVSQQEVETVTGEQWGQTAAIQVIPGERILIANVTPGTDIYSVIRLGSTDLTDTVDGSIATPAAVGDESIYYYDVPAGTQYITVGFVAANKDRIYIRKTITEREGDIGSMNLFNINAYYTGWIYQPAAGGGVEKNYLEVFGQTNVMPVKPGDLINIYGATPNTDNFFVTTHGTNDIDDPVASYLVVPFRSMDGLCFAQFTVPAGISYISVAFLSAYAGRLDVYVGEKSDRKAAVVISCLGDSITQGYIAPDVWADPNYPEIVANRLNCFVTNYGVAGTSICTGSSESFEARLGRMTESWIDCLVIFGGTNDYGDLRAATLGSVSDEPAAGTNFTAAFKHLIEAALTKYPMAQILIVTPMRRQNAGKNANNISMEDIVTAEKAVAAFYGVACYDFYHEGGINPQIAAQRTAYTSDGLHPNQNCINRFVGPCIATAIEPLILYRG